MQENIIRKVLGTSAIALVAMSVATGRTGAGNIA